MKRFLYIIFFLGYPASACFAQLLVSNDLSPSNLVNEILAGPGIIPSNIGFNQNSGNVINTQIGTFSGGSASIGIENGLVISTGQIVVAQGPNDQPSAYIPLPEGEELGEESDLQQIIGPVTIRDVAKLEFDFIARGDTLKFRFVFASEEYNEYTCTAYNDAFGFFISGPGIVGNPSYENNARNIALIPGTTVPIGINTVNQGFAGSSGANAVCNASSPGWQANSIFYINNENNVSPLTTQFDGYTTPFTVEVPVVCGETYHIKLAIADAVDRKNDSAVFIESGSFTSVPPLEASLNVVLPEGESMALEGCSSYELQLTRPDAGKVTPVYIRTNGLDNAYELLGNLPDSVVFELGEFAKSLSIPVLNDGVFDGLRNFDFELLQPATCEMDTFIIKLNTSILDKPALVVNYPDSIWVSCDSNGTIEIVPEGGNPPYTIEWDQQGYAGFNPPFTLDNSSTVSAVVSDACNIHEIPISIVVQKETYAPLQLALPETVEFDCTQPLSIMPVISGGSGDYTYSWMLNGQVVSEQISLNATVPTSGTLYFTVTDRCNGSMQGDVVAQLFDNPISVNLGEDTFGNCDAPVLLLPEVLGGFGDLDYRWYLNQQLVHNEPFYSFVPDRTVSVRLKVDDACGQSETDTAIVFVNNPTLEIAMPEDTVICYGDRFFLEPEVTGGLAPYTYSWAETNGNQSFVSFILENDRSFTLTVEDACGEASVSSVHVEVVRVSAAIEFDYERPERPLRNHSSLDCLYEWMLPDGSVSTDFEPDFIPVKGQGNQVFLTVRNYMGCMDEAVAFYDPPIRIFIPNAFTPDGDGLNDVFKAQGEYIESFEMSIFDRWGRRVFYTDDIRQGWNGEGSTEDEYNIANDTYTYKFKASTWAGGVEEGSGRVQLLR